MSVSKKDFSEVARILKAAKEDQQNGLPTDIILGWLATRFADYFESENGTFNCDEFLDACQLES